MSSVLLAISDFSSQIHHFGFLTLFLLFFLAYFNFSAVFYVFLIALYLTSFYVSEFFLAVYFTLSLLILSPFLRQRIITASIISLIKKAGFLPKISETEKIALTSGNIWVDGELFSGKPNFDKIYSQKYSRLSAAEKLFLENEVEEVCKMCDSFEINEKRDLPKEVWQFLREKKFFGMIIPKTYGGLGFSALGHSAVIEKLASKNVVLAITVMVPNSLGPAELLLHYGTKDQQDHYLPRLAIGEELPCFALTENGAGSDANSLASRGVLFRDSDDKIKIRLNFKKRYITLGAYATVIGVAFKLYDPQKILGENEEIGITCALIPHKTKGVKQGRRHDPLSTPFVNSPLDGENVIIGFDEIIGGQDGLGKGWKMLMESLAAGRGISLPSTSSGGAKMIARAALDYSVLRKQFNTSIAKFEGIEEVLARLTARTYATDAIRHFTCSAVDLGMKPSVVTAIAKYHATENFRKVVNDAMDILGGRAIIRGKRNFISDAYFSTPISITVEGANIITRSLIHFGQGAIMCHPYVYQEIEALTSGDVKKFDRAFFAHIRHFLRNIARSIALSITRAKLINPTSSENALVLKYSRKIAWASATFAMLADFALALFGGNLKRKEKLNGRFGDILSALYISTAILKKFQEEGENKEDEALVKYALEENLLKMQEAFDKIYQNMFTGPLKILMKPFAFFAKFNGLTCGFDDKLEHKIVKNLLKSSPSKERLTQGIFLPSDKNDPLGRLKYAFDLYESCEEIFVKINLAIKEGKLPKSIPEKLGEEAFKSNIITQNQKNKIDELNLAVYDAMEVDFYKI